MSTRTKKLRSNRHQSVDSTVVQRRNRSQSMFHFVDSRPRAAIQKKLSSMCDGSPQVGQLKAFQDMADRALSQPQPAVNAGAVQMDGDGAASTDTIHKAADRGIHTPATALPYAEDIQKSFGRHDISGIQFHNGPVAAQSARDMKAKAYATAGHVVADGPISKHTAAHEAAHYIQQQGGVQLKDGVGAVGDKYEKHADAVGDAVVHGSSAEGLLDQYASSRSATGLQRTLSPQTNPSLGISNNVSAVQRTPTVPEITNAEEQAILKYKGDHFSDMNYVLRNPGAHFTVKQQRAVNWSADADRGLGKMLAAPNDKYKYTGTLWRGDSFDHYPLADRQMMQTQGSQIQILSFFSTSKNRRVGRNYAMNYWNITSNRTGVDIHAAGLGQPQEHEVLFPSGTTFRVDETRTGIGKGGLFGSKKKDRVKISEV